MKNLVEVYNDNNKIIISLPIGLISHIFSFLGFNKINNIIDLKYITNCKICSKYFINPYYHLYCSNTCLNNFSKKQKEILKTVQTLIDGSPSIYSPSSYYQNCMICEKDIIDNLLSTIILKN